MLTFAEGSYYEFLLCYANVIRAVCVYIYIYNDSVSISRAPQ